MLHEVKESIINAYEIKTGQSQAKTSHLMDGETWMNANKAMELGFADGILEDAKRVRTDDVVFAFSRRAVTNSLMNKLIAKPAPKPEHALPAPLLTAIWSLPPIVGTVERTRADRSRRESWTEEMRAAAQQRALKQRRQQ